jgi:hypothetical protein
VGIGLRQTKNMFFMLILVLCLQGIFVKANLKEDVNDIFYSHLKPILESNEKTEKEKFDSMNSLFWPLYLRKMEQDLELERQEKIKQEREQQIYQKYLANRVRGSSILKDFQTMRFFK